MGNTPGSPPLRIHTPTDRRAAAEANVPTVSMVTAQIKNCLERGFTAVAVVGEVSSLTHASSGHVYFSLKDAEACLRCVRWRTAALRNRYAIKEGTQIIARGRLSVYPVRGEYQLQVDVIQQQGVGAQDLALQRLKEKLKGLGYFAQERKRSL